MLRNLDLSILEIESIPLIWRLQEKTEIASKDSFGAIEASFFANISKTFSDVNFNHPKRLNGRRLNNLSVRQNLGHIKM